MSPSSRRAWIEIHGSVLHDHDVPSPSSRRAWIEITIPSLQTWENRSPSSRRAWIEIGLSWLTRLRHQVALLAEGVDRNDPYHCIFLPLRTSPSSRRAWIEIPSTSPPPTGGWVALLAEGVDRNGTSKYRRQQLRVALLAEGVDRNFFPSGSLCQFYRRPPRGGRR